MEFLYFIIPDFHWLSKNVLKKTTVKLGILSFFKPLHHPVHSGVLKMRSSKLKQVEEQVKAGHYLFCVLYFCVINTLQSFCQCLNHHWHTWRVIGA